MKFLHRISSGLRDLSSLALVIVLFIMYVVSLPMFYGLYLRCRKEGYAGGFEEWLEDFWGDSHD